MKQKEKLDEIKVDSYYQRKKTQDEIDEDAKVARPTTLVGKRKKHWVDLDTEGFEEQEGVIVQEVSDSEDVVEEKEEQQKEPTAEEPLTADDPSDKEEDKSRSVEGEEEEEEDDILILNLLMRHLLC